MTNESSVSFHLAEVVDHWPLTSTYELRTEDGFLNNQDHLYSIAVRLYDSNGAGDPLICMPANSNIKQIPVLGEHVLIFQGTNQYSTIDKTRYQWYYFPAYNIQSNINNNALPGITKRHEGDKTKPEKDFGPKPQFKKSISPLQQYDGDIIIEGRFSNSIRLGSTIETKFDQYTLKPTWVGKDIGDPIIILSNKRKDNKDRKFITEDVDDDSSSLYLTSMQKLPKLKLWRSLSKSKSQTAFNSSQLIGSANRIVLTAKSDSIILDSPQMITLNTPQLRIGNENAGHALVKGDVLVNVLQNLINYIQAGVEGPAGIYSYPDSSTNGFLNNLKIQISRIKSQKHYFDK